MRRMINMTSFWVLMAASTALPAHAADPGWGWFGSSEVRVPGQGVKVAIVKGVITAPNVATALAIANGHARNQAAQYGEIVREPVIELISPFYVPSIRDGIREDLRPSGG